MISDPVGVEIDNAYKAGCEDAQREYESELRHLRQRVADLTTERDATVREHRDKQARLGALRRELQDMMTRSTSGYVSTRQIADALARSMQ